MGVTVLTLKTPQACERVHAVHEFVWSLRGNNVQFLGRSPKEINPGLLLVFTDLDTRVG